METPGKIASRAVGGTDITLNLAVLVWYTRGMLSPSEFTLFSFDFIPFRVMIAFYFVMAVVIPLLLIYSTYQCSSVCVRKRLAVLWCIFRGLSFIFLVIYVFFSGRKTMDKFSFVVVSGNLLFWAVGIYMGTMYVSALYMEAILPAVRKRKVSSVAVLNEEEACGAGNGVLTEDHLKQLENFQAYVHRTSWCSERLQKSGNSLEVPDSRF